MPQHRIPHRRARDSRARAHAISVSSPAPVAWLAWLVLLTLLLAGTALGQTTQQPPITQQQTTPPPAIQPGTKPGDEGKTGVITPPSNHDPDIVVPTPAVPHNGTVIPPPGAPGGNPAVVPK